MVTPAGEVPLERVVAVVGVLPDGRSKWGSGFLLTPTLVLTAWHCTVDSPRSGTALGGLRVERHTEQGWESAAVSDRVYAKSSRPGSDYEWGLDVAVLRLTEPPWQESAWVAPEFGRVDRSHSGVVSDCLAVGYPMYMLSEGHQRDTDSVRGFVSVEQGAVSGYLTLQDRSGRNVAVPSYVSADQTTAGSPWGGLSGAALFHHGRILGHVVQHRPHLGSSQVTVVPIEQIAAAAASKPDSGPARVATRLGLPSPDLLRLVATRSASRWTEALQWRSLTAGSPQRVASITDLAVFGVHTQVMLDLEYLPRDVDPALTAALDSAVASPRMVLVTGDSAAGKSRAAAWALQHHPAIRNRLLLKPRLRNGVSQLAEADLSLPDAVVWLDDLDKYLAAGLDVDHLARLLDSGGRLVIVATIRSSQLSGRKQLTDPIGEFLNDPARVVEVVIPASLSQGEIEVLSAQSELDPELLAQTREGVGLGEWLVAGPRLISRLAGASEVQAAVAATVIGWYRTGLQRPLPEEEARQLWPQLLARPAHDRAMALTAHQRDEYYDRAVEWLTEPLQDLARDLHEQRLATRSASGLAAHDYVVDHVSRDPSAPPVVDQLWAFATRAALALANPGERYSAAWAIGVAAYSQEAYEQSLAVWDTLAEHGIPLALVSKGATLSRLDRSAEEIAAYDQVLAWVGDDSSDSAIEAVSTALYAKGLAFGRQGRQKQAIDAYGELINRFGDASSGALRHRVARALVNVSVAVAELGHTDEILPLIDEILDRYGDDPTPELHEPLARTLTNKASIYMHLGRPDEALLLIDEVLDRFRGDSNPDVQAPLALASVLKAASLGQLGRPDEALRLLDVVLEKYHDDPHPDLRQPLALASVNKAASLVQLGRHEEALPLIDEVLDRYRDDPRPDLRQPLALAWVNKAASLVQLGRLEEALPLLDEVLDRYRDDPHPDLRQPLALACVNKAAGLVQLGRPEDALPLIHEVLERYGSDPNTHLRLPLALALANGAGGLVQLGRPDEALAMIGQLWDRFSADPDPALRSPLAIALVNKGVALGQLNRPTDEIAAYDEVVNRFAGGPETSSQREQVASALMYRGLTLGQLERPAEEIRAYDQVLALLEGDPHPVLRERSATALVGKGAALAQLDDEPAARRVWQQVLADFSEQSWPVGVAALNLAALGAVDGRLNDALALLETGRQAGVRVAPACADSLSGEPDVRTGGLRQLQASAEDTEDTDALNFLGIAAFSSGDRSAAIELWTRSLSIGDRAAQLLLARTVPGQPSGTPRSVVPGGRH